MSFEDVFRVFVMATFYVGKGKRTRPYAHFNEALQPSKVRIIMKAVTFLFFSCSALFFRKG